MQLFAVIDCETTGFGASDRIIELSIVVLRGPDFETVHEFDTLLNPERDVGRSDIHGITPAMLGAAPSFSEVAPRISRVLHGSVLVAHNLAFDERMLRQECERVGVEFDSGSGICTLGLSGSKLDVAAAANGIELSQHHRALADARVAAELLKRLWESDGDEVCVRMDPAAGSDWCRTLRREATADGVLPTTLRKLLGRACYPSSENRVRVYFDLLDWALADGTLSPEEKRHVEMARCDLGLSPNEVVQMHRAYLASVRDAILRDGRVTDQEAKLYARISRMLGLGDATLEVTAKPSHATTLKRGSRICFTGSAIDASGNALERSDLERRAAAAGFQPVRGVTKKGCDLLVAEDPDSMSGKAKNAVKWGIPIMSVKQFLAEV